MGTLDLEEVMKYKDKMYWFFRNLLALLLSIPFDLAYMPVVLIRRIKILFRPDGGCLISYPWEWNWRLDGRED